MHKLHRVLAQIGATALLATGVATGITVAGVAPASAANGTDLTFYLTPPDPAALQELSQATDLTHEQRIARLEALLPDPAPVEQRLRSLGLTVTGADSWSVTAEAPTTLVDSLFGTRPSLASVVGATVDEIRAAAGSLPQLPQVLHGLVSAVLPAGGPATLTPHVGYTGPQIRSTYTMPYDGSGSNPTVASIQFSNDPSLASDMSAVGAVAPGQVQSVAVDGGATGTADATEVALDQEALLAVGPTLHQRIYYAPNGNPGMIDAFKAVLNDVTAGRSDIVALTTSWGQCESQTGATLINTMEPILQSLVAAGVTVFAASGDDGIYDCGSPGSGLACLLNCPGTHDVDYPASSPSVIGVGATSLGASESGWTCTSGTNTLTATADCYAHGGTGGGASGSGAKKAGDFTGFAKPSYQSVIRSAPFSASTKRLVPDIAAVGDPAPGFDVVVGDTTQSNVGGTSLSTPVSAAMFADALSHYGVQAGIGDIHALLYNLMSSPTSVNAVGSDLTSGQNGAAGDAATGTAVTAGVGYDTVTGTGSVRWGDLAPYLLPSVPTVAASMSANGGNVNASWTVGKTPRGAAIRSVSVSITGPDGSVVASVPSAPTSGVAVFPGIPGGRYVMNVNAQDLLGHSGCCGNTARLTMPLTTSTSPQISFSGHGAINVDDAGFRGPGWKHVRSRGAFGRKVLQTSKPGKRVKVSVAAQTVTLSFFAGPSNGKLTVLVDGKRVTIDEYSKHRVRTSVTLLTSSAPAMHALQFVSSSAHNPRSRGHIVDVDFLTAYLP